MFGDAGIDRRENILLIQRWQRALRLVLFLALECFLEAALNGFPSILHDRFALCLELVTLTGERDRSLIIDVLLTGSAQKAHGDKPDNFLLRLRQLGEVLIFKLDGGDNGMMVSDLGVVGNSPDVRLMGNALEERQLAGDNADHLTGGALHILSDELTVRSGIGKQLFLIEGLHQIERLLGGKAIVAVGFPLQGGKIIEPRRVDRLCLLLKRRNDGLLFVASRRNRLRLIFCFDILQFRRQVVFADMDIEVFLLVESGDFAFSLHQHCQRRRLDAPDHQLLMIERREQPCTVDPNNPVRLGTGKGGFVEPVILAAVPQMVKALSDCAVFQRADPQAFERLRATGFLVDQPKNQLALAPRIGGADKLGYTLIAHKVTQHLELLLLVLRDFKQPFLRDDGKIAVPPLGKALIIGACVCKPHQMTNAPRDDVVVSFEIAVLTGGCAQNLPDGGSNTRFFRNH